MDPLAQYTPGMRRPTPGEVPGPVLNAVRLMWVGLVFSVIELVFALGAMAGYATNANTAKSGMVLYPFHASAGYKTLNLVVKHNETWSAVVASFAVSPAAIGIICWIVLAIFCRGGRGWTRVAGTVLFALNSICTLFVLVGSVGDPGLKGVAGITWAIGLAVVILLWNGQASAFFSAWRKHAPPRV
jgi:hypothetical protein